MKRIVSYLVVFAVGAAAGIGVCFMAVGKKDPEIKIVEKTRVISEPVKRDYAAMQADALRAALSCYDTAEPRLDMTMTGDTAHLSAGLCDRNWSRDVSIEVGTSGNWKLYASVAGVAAVAGGFAMYRIMR